MYQWLHAWEACVGALTDRAVGAADPVVAVGVEVAGTGNLDDLVRFRRQPPHSYSQIKYAVDAKTSVGTDYLLKPSSSGGPSILGKIASTWQRLIANGSPVRLALITNRPLDSRDPLVSQCDMRTMLLMPRAGEGSANSARGRARRRWAAALGLAEAELLELLEVLQFDSVSVARLRSAVAAQMRAIGLPGEDKDLEAGANWIERQVRDSYTEMDLDVIDQAVAKLWPEARLAMPQASMVLTGFNARAGAESEGAVRDRLSQLPAFCRERLIEVWREYPHDAWQLMTDLTRTQPPPGEVLADWANRRPPWLDAAAWRVRLVAGELAGAYGQGRLAADLFCGAAADGAVRADFWLARAALIYDELGDDQARARTLDHLGPGPSREPYARAAVAFLSGDPETADRELGQWTPHPDERVVRTLTRVRIALAAAGDHFTAPSLSQALQVVSEPPEPLLGSTGIAIVRARLLIVRARRGESGNWDRDLREAADLLLWARDEIRAFRGDSAEALARLCEIRLMQQDAPAVIHMATYGDSGATRTEADHPRVREHLAIAALLVGDFALARECQRYFADELAQVRVAAALAEAEGGDSAPFWRRAIDLADNDEQLAQALYGLAQTGTDDLPRLEELAARHPDQVIEIYAQAELASGRPRTAIRLLRSHRTESIPAALTLAHAYGAAGRVDDQVQTLTDAARHFGDASLSLTAAEILARNGRFADAERLLDELLARTPANWAARRPALRLAAHLAHKDRRPDRACELLRTALDLDPNDSATRWTLIDILLHRGEVDTAWQELSQAPKPLDPTNAAQARLWIHLNVRRGSSTTTVTTCLRLLRRFADNQDFIAFVANNLIISGTIDDTVPTYLRDEVHAEFKQFFERWPTNPLRRIPAADLTAAIAQVSEIVRPSEEALQHRRYLMRGVLTGSLPLSVLAASAGRSYAEVLVLRGGSVIPVRHPDPREHSACIAAATAHTDADIVLDTTAAVVLNILSGSLRNTALGMFARAFTTDTVTLDALAARDFLAMRSTASLVFDEHHRTLVIEHTSAEEADRLADEASGLLTFIRRLDRMPRPESSILPLPDLPPLITWTSAADLALQQHSALWSDDPVLRAIARDAGIPATSTPAVLRRLLDRGDISTEEHEAAIRTLISARIADFPLNEQRLFELAEDDNWQPRGVAYALSRPGAWRIPSRAARLFSRLVVQICAHQPRTLHDWLYLAVQGAAGSAPTPGVATDITARLMAIAMETGKADATAAVTLTVAARRALAQTADPDQPARPDPLPGCARLIRDVYARYFRPDLATQLALSLVSEHNKDDRLAVVEALLT
ncbi:PIN domain-containing protein [Microbispora bryophytorum]|uniref:PIN domain-containing protein n=1 Tax=Microbispora bryophytorum TaxID=1460882 RepID=UPI0033E74770